MAFHPAERTVILVSGALAAADAFLIWWKDIVVDLEVFAIVLCIGSVFIGLGQIYRHYRDSERIALTMHAFGLYIIYWLFCGVFNTVLLPLRSEPIDAALVRADAWLGYSWPDLCAWIAGYPVLNVILRTVYSLTASQLLLSFVLLGFLLDRQRLHTAMLTTVLGSLMVIFCWALLPSAGASAYWVLAPEIDSAVQPAVDSAHGAELYRLYKYGVHDLTTISVKGLVGFPSFHTVMAFISIVAVWPYRAFRNALLVAGIFLFPAILIHGGHNLVDLIAGLAIAVIAWLLSSVIFEAQERVKLKPAPGRTEALPEATAA
jgi:hypothetical protein